MTTSPWQQPPLLALTSSWLLHSFSFRFGKRYEYSVGSSPSNQTIHSPNRYGLKGSALFSFMTSSRLHSYLCCTWSALCSFRLIYLFQLLISILMLICSIIGHSFSAFVRPRPGKFFFYKTRARSQQIYS